MGIHPPGVQFLGGGLGLRQMRKQSSAVALTETSITFTEVVGNATAALGSLTKNALPTGWNAYGRSVATIGASASYAQWIVSDADIYAGLSVVDPDASVGVREFAFYSSKLNGNIYIKEEGTNMATHAGLSGGEVLKIAISAAGVVTFLVDDVLEYTSLTASPGAMMFSCNLYTYTGGAAAVTSAVLAS